MQIIGADLTMRGKPYPDPINLALKQLNYYPDRKSVFFIGDSINNQKSAGVTSVLL